MQDVEGPQCAYVKNAGKPVFLHQRPNNNLENATGPNYSCFFFSPQSEKR
uniref:Uncharacterized protein n=1 Tax=Anguilla anguilla TaxID=7936 RepID=A0A0E9V7N3_ANGAN